MQLFDGEIIDGSLFQARSEQVLSADEMNEKYVRGDIRIVTEQARYPLNTIVSMLDSGNYDLNPEFQRRHRWSRDKQSRLMESFIMNVPIPPIFLYETEYSKFEVMDGLQRLTAISEFYRGAFELQGLQEWSELNGFDYFSLPEQLRRGIDRRYLSSIVLLQETAKTHREAQRLKQLVFERINSGGEKLEPQESRNALYNGPLNQLCIQLSAHDSFRRMWGMPTADDYDEPQFELEFAGEDEGVALEYEKALAHNPLYQKMVDVELVLRFFAYRQLDYIDQGRLRDFLDEFLKHGNLFGEDILNRYRLLFRETCDFLYALLGERAFYLLRKRKNGAWGWFERPTKVLYDPLMAAACENLANKEALLARRESITADLRDFFTEREDLFAGRSTNKQDLINRRNQLSAFLAGKAA